MAPEETVELPELLGRYFWDYAAGRLTWPEDRYMIVFRLLEKGGPEAVDWLRKHVGNAEIRDVLMERKGRGIDPKRLRYWEPILGLPKDQVDVWIATAMRNPWYNRCSPRSSH